LEGGYIWGCRERAEAERKAVNSVIQGSAADIIKAAMACWAVANAENDMGSHHIPLLGPPAVRPSLWLARLEITTKSQPYACINIEF